MSTTATLHPNPVCPHCGCKIAAKKGKRRNRLQTLQVYRCTECLHRFTGAAGKNKTYPLRLILETVSTFNLGYSLTETQRLLHTRFHRNIPERTISSWLTEYRPLTTYAPACVVQEVVPACDHPVHSYIPSSAGVSFSGSSGEARTPHATSCQAG